MQFLIHPNFELNGTSFNKTKDLIVYSKSISSIISSFLTDFLDETDSIKLQTSGSTGVPKVIKVRKEFMSNSAKATGTFFNLKENTTALLCMNPKFVGAKMMLVRALVLGWKLDVIVPSSNPLKEIDKTYDFCAMVSLQVHNSLSDLNKIKALIIGGGVVSVELTKSLQNVKTNCYVTYGMTETVSHIAVQKLNNYTSLRGGTKKQSHYSILPNIHISKDKRNCLKIDAPQVSDSEIITNDIVEIISDSEFKWLGRYDTIINSGGIKLIPEQIEKKLSTIIDQRFFVSSLTDKVLSEKLILIVEGKGNSNVILSKTKNLKTLTKYEIPKEVYFIPNFVETETKKIQRKKTLELLF